MKSVGLLLLALVQYAFVWPLLVCMLICLWLPNHLMTLEARGTQLQNRLSVDKLKVTEQLSVVQQHSNSGIRDQQEDVG
jgi:hypothetical protein